MKSLKDISWLVTEEEYRADPALSYSTLARFEREGFEGLPKLFDKIESPSLTFGSMVDTLITGTQEEFDERFMVAQLDNNLSDALINITKTLFNKWKDTYHSLPDIPEDYVIDTIADIQWNNHWLPKTRVKKIKEDCSGYYALLYLANDRTIVSTLSYQDALNCVDRLKSAPSTRFYFEEDLFDKNIERLYQLKFKATFDNVDYRCMADLLITFHKEKIVVPVDLKTSSKPEYNFYKSFIDWKYDIQSRLYWKIIRDNMDKDDYFKDFKLADYKFIVINRKTLNPLVWNFNKTQSEGELVTPNGVTLRHPFEIGKQLRRYLDEKPVVPDGIDLIKPNELSDKI
jgi:hypothetical protein